MSKYTLRVVGFNRETWTDNAEVSTEDFGILCYETKGIPFPERDVEFISVPGRNGDLSLDNGKWRNVTLEFSLVAYTSKVNGLTMSGREKIESFLAQIGAFRGYLRLYYSGKISDQPFYRNGVFLGGKTVTNSPETINNGMVMSKTTIQFSAKPQKYFQVPDFIVEPGQSRDITNPMPLTALPEVRMLAPGTIRMANAQIQFTPADTEFTQALLDCELKNALGRVASGEAWRNANRLISASNADWFPIPPGTSTVVNNTSGNLEISPRWWSL